MYTKLFIFFFKYAFFCEIIKRYGVLVLFMWKDITFVFAANLTLFRKL